MAARIIPARAGFTTRPVRFGRCSADHPRSRGVYPGRVIRNSSLSGSSPLARGLHRSPVQQHDHPGIIPARAGFTPSPATTPTRASDHPRSRGVYDVDIVGGFVHCGSSPLARGLPPTSQSSTHCHRIIPARAGFTPRGYGPARAREDHPRSRGVYGSVSPSRTMIAGSSPLARGLLAHPLPRPVSVRIIPARAGFTGTARRTRSASADHPRSRGVYWRRWA